MKEFELTRDHILLLKGMCWDHEDSMEFGAPAADFETCIDELVS